MGCALNEVSEPTSSGGGFAPDLYHSPLAWNEWPPLGSVQARSTWWAAVSWCVFVCRQLGGTKAERCQGCGRVPRSLIHKSQGCPATGKQIFTTVHDNQTECCILVRPARESAGSTTCHWRVV